MIDIKLFDKVVIELEKDFGPFHIFALLLREDAPGVWDLVISSKRLAEEKFAGLSELNQSLLTLLPEEERLKISSIYTFDLDDEVLQEMIKCFSETENIEEIRDMTFGQVEIEKGYVFRASSQLLHTELV